LIDICPRNRLIDWLIDWLSNTNPTKNRKWTQVIRRISSFCSIMCIILLYTFQHPFDNECNHTNGEMSNVFFSTAVDRGFEPRCGQTKHWNWYLLVHVDFCVSELTKDPLKRVGLIQNGHHHFIECNLFLPWYCWQIWLLGSGG